MALHGLEDHSALSLLDLRASGADADLCDRFHEVAGGYFRSDIHHSYVVEELAVTILLAHNHIALARHTGRSIAGQKNLHSPPHIHILDHHKPEHCLAHQTSNKIDLVGYGIPREVRRIELVDRKPLRPRSRERGLISVGIYYND